MDRLRSPGGCPWDAEQTHASLIPYALEEAYEVADAVDREDWDELVEELGDLLLQVVFHARVAEDRTRAEGGFTIDDVANSLVAKLVRRHPHVFEGVELTTEDELYANWENVKRAEREAKGSTDTKGRELAASLARIPRGTPPTVALPKVAEKVGKAGLDVADLAREASSAEPEGAVLGEALLDVAVRGGDPDGELRAWLAAFVAAAGAAEEAAARGEGEA
ncbi:MAG: MazG family protein [bacterium]|nr:MazG family protein [bacterium]